jgi:hypothetical protein
LVTICIWRDSPAARTPLSFSLIVVECLPPQSYSLAAMDYKVPTRVFIKKDMWVGRDPLLPTYVGHIGTKPVYDSNGPLESMDSILIRTEMGVCKVTTEEWGGLKGCPVMWGTTVKDRWRIICDPSLHVWSVLGGALASALEEDEEYCHYVDEDEDSSLSAMTFLSNRNQW